MHRSCSTTSCNTAHLYILLHPIHELALCFMFSATLMFVILSNPSGTPCTRPTLQTGLLTPCRPPQFVIVGPLGPYFGRRKLESCSTENADLLALLPVLCYLTLFYEPRFLGQPRSQHHADLQNTRHEAICRPTYHREDQSNGSAELSLLVSYRRKADEFLSLILCHVCKARR